MAVIHNKGQCQGRKVAGRGRAEGAIDARCGEQICMEQPAFSIVYEVPCGVLDCNYLELGMLNR